MEIGEASRASGVSARSLRYYGDEGLIVPGLCRNGYRDYCRSTPDRARVIRSPLESGLPVRWSCPTPPPGPALTQTRRARSSRTRCRGDPRRAGPAASTPSIPGARSRTGGPCARHQGGPLPSPYRHPRRPA
ncbi:MerR family transcriptional regulator [Nocardiopsis sp. FR6]|uniref:MerR family transcriptional regulator n=1 Tax=Nocardiopsis sp. FR6 TaxID=2605986 RepID=UPI001915D1CE